MTSDFTVTSANLLQVDPKSVRLEILGANLNGAGLNTDDLQQPWPLALHWVSVVANGVYLGANGDRLSWSNDRQLAFDLPIDKARGLTNILVFRDRESVQTIPVAPAPTPTVTPKIADHTSAGFELFAPVSGDNLGPSCERHL